MMSLTVVPATNADVRTVKVVPYPTTAGKLASYHISFNVTRPLSANQDSISITLPKDTMVPEYVSSAVISVNPQKLIDADYVLDYDTGEIEFIDPLQEGDQVIATYYYTPDRADDYTTLSQDKYKPYSISADPDADYDGFPMPLNPAWISFYDRSFPDGDSRNNNGIFDPGEWLYEDRDQRMGGAAGAGRISPGDRRLMVIHDVLNAGAPANTDDGPNLGELDARQNSFVAPNDGDCGGCSQDTPLPSFPINPLMIINLMFLDMDGDGIYTEGDFLFDDVNMNGIADTPDIMLTGMPELLAGSLVGAKDPDVGTNPANVSGGGGFSLERFYDAATAGVPYRYLDGTGGNLLKNNMYDPGEYIYRDIGPSYDYTVDAGDVRETAVSWVRDNGYGGEVEFYPVGSVVQVGDADVGQRLVEFNLATGLEEGYLDLSADQEYDPGEPIYRNATNNPNFFGDNVKVGYERLSGWLLSAYRAGSQVEVGDVDLNYSIVRFNSHPVTGIGPERITVNTLPGPPTNNADEINIPNYYCNPLWKKNTTASFDNFDEGTYVDEHYIEPHPTGLTPDPRMNMIQDFFVYRDNDKDDRITVGDDRLSDVFHYFGIVNPITPPIPGSPGRVNYFANSTVVGLDGDVRLRNPAINDPRAWRPLPLFPVPDVYMHTDQYALQPSFISGPNHFDPHEFIYVDVDQNRQISIDDIRLDAVGVTSFGQALKATYEVPRPLSNSKTSSQYQDRHYGATLTKGFFKIEDKVIVPYASAGQDFVELSPKKGISILPTLEPPRPNVDFKADYFKMPFKTNLQDSGTWYYRITPENIIGEGQPSEPLEINLNQGSGYNTLRIYWDPIPYARFYNIYRSRNPNFFPEHSFVASVATPGCEYIDFGTPTSEGTLPESYNASFIKLWRIRDGVKTELVEAKCSDYEIDLESGLIKFNKALSPDDIVLADYKHSPGKHSLGPSSDPCKTVGHQDEQLYVDFNQGVGKFMHKPVVEPSIDPSRYCLSIWRAPSISPDSAYLLKEGVDYFINYEKGEVRFESHVVKEGDVITADYDSYETVVGESLVEATHSSVKTAKCSPHVLPDSYTIYKAVNLSSSPQIKVTSGPNGHQLVFTTPIDIAVDQDNDTSTPDVVVTLNKPGRNFSADAGAVRNPPKAGSYQLWVSTSQEQTPILSSPYEITADTTSENMKLKIISPQVPPQQPNDPPCDCKDAAGTAGQVMSIAAQLTDGSNGISGVYIRFQIDDTVNPPSTFSSSNLVQTNDQGLASVVLNLSATPGVTRIKVYLQDDPSICRCVDINTGPPVEVDRIVISPGPTLALSPGTLQQFTATAFKANGAQIPGVEFTWASDCGSINQAGLYTAPVDAGSTCHVFARAHGKEGMTTVSIVSRPSRITVNPPSAIVASGSQKQFTAQAYDDIGNPMSIPINWSIEPAGLGTFTSDGTFTAGNISGTGTVKACSAGVCGTATVTVQTAGNITSVKVTPANATMKIGQTQQFTAKALDQNGFEVQGASFTWMVQPSTMGTISSNGLFVASSPGTAIITAQSGSVTGMAIVNIVEISRIEINPSGLTKVARGDTQLFTAVAYNTAGAAIPGMNFNWSVTPAGVGTLTPSGSTATFTATGMDGQTAIIMIEAAGLTATAQVQIGAKDSTPPTVTSSPDSGIKDGETALVGTGQIKVSVSDSEGIATVSVNGVPATSDGQGNWVATVNVNKGTNEFIVKAVDNNGNEAEETIRAYGSYQTEMILNIDTTQPYATLTKDGTTSQVKLNTVPEIFEGRTYVGLRDLGEKLLGGTVVYDGNTKMITITITRSNGNKDVLQTVIGQNDFRVTRTTPTGQQTVEDYVLENPPYISNYPYASHFKSVNKDRTMVPMRSIIEAVVGKTVEQTGQNSVDYDSLTRNATFRFIP